MGKFDEILNKVDEADRAVLNKYPDLKKSLDTLETDYQVANSKLHEWETWKADAWDPEAKTTKSERAVREAYQQAQERIAALETAAGSDMTLEEISNHIKQTGYATKQDIEAIVEARTRTLQEKLADREYVDKKNNDISAGFGHIFQKTYNLGRHHEKEFGEDLDIGGVFKYMTDNKINDPEVAYNQMMVTKRTEIATKKATELEEKHKAEVEAARKQGEELAAKKFGMGQNGKIPTDQTGADNSMGHIQRKAIDKVKKATDDATQVPDKVQLGQQILSELGYQDLLKNREAGAA